MNVKSIAVAAAVLLTVVGGAAAVSGAGLTDAGAAASGDVNVATTYDNGTVTVDVTQNGTAVENATVEVAGEEYTTDANGTVTAENVDVEAGDDLDVEVEADGFEAELSYTLQDGTLQLVEEKYEYEQAEDDEADEGAAEDAADEDAEDEEADEDADDADEEETETEESDDDAEDAEADDADEEDDDDKAEDDS